MENIGKHGKTRKTLKNRGKLRKTAKNIGFYEQLSVRFELY